MCCLYVEFMEFEFRVIVVKTLKEKNLFCMSLFLNGYGLNTVLYIIKYRKRSEINSIRIEINLILNESY